MGRRLIFDIESDGLLKAVAPTKARPDGIRKNTQVWCIGAVDIDTGEEFYWGVDKPGSLEDCYKVLAEADLLLAHNGIGYDYPALEMLVPGWKRPANSWDTMVIAKVVWPAEVLLGPDLKTAARLGMDGKQKAEFLKRHSLKAWGIRTGTHKADYSGGFAAWNQEMADYMMDDVRATLALWRLIEKRLGWVDPKPGEPVWPRLAIEMENEVATIIQRQEAYGIRFDVPKAQALAAHLTNERARLEAGLVAAFGSWWQPSAVHTEGRDVQYKRPEFPDVTIRRVSEKTGKELKPYVGPPLEHRFEGATSTPIKRLTFNPSSRDHLGMRLQDVYGWVPKNFGANGKPTVDESVLKEIPESVMPPEVRKLILDYFVVNKTLGMLATGNKAWLKLVTEGGRIHGRVDTGGTVTGRCAHSDPNLGQCPAVKKAKVKQPDGSVREEVLRGLEGRYGAECRELFAADEGWEQTGIDASALELIDLGHYLQPHDDGVFMERVCDPKRDPHTEHAELTGLTRADTKTATYLYVYGGSAYKLSLDLTVTPDEIPELLAYRGLPMLLKSLAKRFAGVDPAFVDKLDDGQKARIAKARKIIVAFENGIAGIKSLKEGVTDAAKRGWLRGMDGRRMIVRKAHAALNTLLQSAGAQSCKLWVMRFHQKMEAAGFVWGVDYAQTLFVHDEIGITHRPGIGPIVAQYAEEAMREAGELLGLRGTYRTNAQHGANWYETH